MTMAETGFNALVDVDVDVVFVISAGDVQKRRKKEKVHLYLARRESRELCHDLAGLVPLCLASSEFVCGGG